MKPLEEGGHKEALLLTRHLKLCDCATQLAENLATLKGDELHRALQPVVDEGVQLPFRMQLKLCQRRCQEVMEQHPDSFLHHWSVWSVAGVDYGDSFNPLLPKLKPISDGLADEDLTIQQKSRDEEWESKEDEKLATETLVGNVKAGCWHSSTCC